MFGIQLKLCPFKQYYHLSLGPGFGRWGHCWWWIHEEGSQPDPVVCSTVPPWARFKKEHRMETICKVSWTCAIQTLCLSLERQTVCVGRTQILWSTGHPEVSSEVSVVWVTNVIQTSEVFVVDFAKEFFLYVPRAWYINCQDINSFVWVQSSSTAQSLAEEIFFLKGLTQTLNWYIMQLPPWMNCRNVCACLRNCCVNLVKCSFLTCNYDYMSFTLRTFWSSRIFLHIHSLQKRPPKKGNIQWGPVVWADLYWIRIIVNCPSLERER